MTEINITQAKALRLLQEAVKVKGEDYVYEQPTKPEGSYGSCLYTDKDSNPSCIVGYALANAGVPIEVLHAIDWGGAVYLDYDDDSNDDKFIERTAHESLDDTGINDGNVAYWLKHEGVEIDDAAMDLFRVAQTEQDNGTSWGKAVDNAVKYVGRNGR